MPQYTSSADFDNTQSTVASIEGGLNQNSQSSTFSTDNSNEITIVDNTQNSFLNIIQKFQTNLDYINSSYNLLQKASVDSENIVSDLSKEFNLLNSQKADIEKRFNDLKELHKNLLDSLQNSTTSTQIEELKSRLPEEYREIINQFLEDKAKLEQYTNIFTNVVNNKEIVSNEYAKIPDNEIQILEHFSKLKTQDQLQVNVLTSLLSNENYTEEDFNHLKPILQELISKYLDLKLTQENQTEIILKLLSNSAYDKEFLSSQDQNFISFIQKYNTIEDTASELSTKLDDLNSDIIKVKNYISTYGLKQVEKPTVSNEFSDLLIAIDTSLKKTEENVKLGLYMQISDAISKGETSALPADLLQIINHLIIERLEDIVKPYEELSSKYVSGKITHDEFTQYLRKNALLSLMREKIIEDIIREYENNNLTSSIIPDRLKIATERMINDSKRFQNIITQETRTALPTNNIVNDSGISSTFFTT